jgi:hypothetical protein
MLSAMKATLLIAVLLVSAAQATEVYRWVDASGQVHYSDQWAPGAERVSITAAPGFSAPAPGAPGADEAGEGEETPGRYQTLQILSPAQEEVLWNIEGQLPVSVQVEPSLLPGQVLRLYLDDKAVADLPPGSTQTRLQDVYRGSHTLRAEVVDPSGRTLASSPAVRFAVRQTSIQNPQNPLRQAPPPPIPAPR